ncbi:MAG: hydrogenase maturation nickel metallochaperone HypA [Dysgonamonadaceae bacterium]|jgi:hydrogenase nickel incorporation protein HypA/HybF|nr:hydrogenase maturation nickel metallochaperone HypA [Dysgonamonadaceae bacterium]
MHEVSIAQSIVDLAIQQAESHSAIEVEELELEIGVLSGIEIPALAFALESCVMGTWLEKTRIVRHDIPGEGKCGDCGESFPIKDMFSACPFCGSFAVRITKGKELRIKSIVIK